MFDKKKDIENSEIETVETETVETVEETVETEAVKETSETEKTKEKKVKKEKSKKEFKIGAASKKEVGRHLKYGSLSVVLTALFIAAVIVCNIVINEVAKKIPEFNIDITDRHLYDITEVSTEYLKTLEDYDIDITFIGSKQTLMGDTNYNKIVTFTEKYAKLAPNISVDFVDLDKTPGFSSQFDNIELIDGDAIVKCGDRYRQLTSADFLVKTNEEEVENSQDSANPVAPKYALSAEYALTTAIMVVTASDNPKATVITGHGEVELDKLTRLLENNGFEVTTQSIATDIDYSNNLLIITAPTKDYSEEDLKKLDDFLYNDGKYGRNIMYIADYSQPVLPNLEAFLYDWGIVLGEGIVYESDESVAYANMPYLNTLTFIDTDTTLQSAYAEVTAYGYYGRPAKIANTLDVNMINSIVLQHSETSKAGTMVNGNFAYADENEQEEAYIAMAYTTHQKLGTDMKVAESSLVFVNSTQFFEGQLFTKDYSANPDVTIAVVDKLLGRSNRVTIPSKNLSAASLGITYNQANLIGTIAAVIIPIALLVTCLVIYIRRRYL